MLRPDHQQLPLVHSADGTSRTDERVEARAMQDSLHSQPTGARSPLSALRVDQHWPTNQRCRSGYTIPKRFYRTVGPVIEEGSIPKLEQ